MGGLLLHYRIGLQARGAVLRIVAIVLTVIGSLGFVFFGIVWRIAAGRPPTEDPLGQSMNMAEALSSLRLQSYVILACGAGVFGGAILQLKRRDLLGGSVVLFAASLTLLLTPKWAGVMLAKAVVVLAGVLAVVVGRLNSGAAKRQNT